jgi:hypothetical protein
MRYSVPIGLILAAGMLIGLGPIGAGGAAFAQNYKPKSHDQIAADTAALKARWYRFGGANAAVGSAGQASNRNGGNRGGGGKK